MEPVRIVLALCFFGMAAAAFFIFTDTSSYPGIRLSDAQLSPMGDGFALTLKIENTGGPDVLTGLASDEAGQTTLAGAMGSRVAIPAQSSPSLAMDGAHGMVNGILGSTGEGRLVPITLWFENAGKITTRAKIIGGRAMDHTAVHDVPKGQLGPSMPGAFAWTPGISGFHEKMQMARIRRVSATGTSISMG